MAASNMASAGRLEAWQPPRTPLDVLPLAPSAVARTNAEQASAGYWRVAIMPVQAIFGHRVGEGSLKTFHIANK